MTKRIVVIGDAGTGKSTLINQMFGANATVGRSARGVTKAITCYPCTGDVEVYDTPGLGDRDVPLNTLVQLLNENFAGKEIDAIVLTYSLLHPRLSLGHQVIAALLPKMVPGMDPFSRVLLVGTHADDPNANCSSDVPHTFGEMTRCLSFTHTTSGIDSCGAVSDSLSRMTAPTATNPPIVAGTVTRDDVVDVVSIVTGIAKAVVGLKAK